MNLYVDQNRRLPDESRGVDQGTGIFVRALSGTQFVSCDICELDKASLLTWLKSRGGDNRVAEDVVGILLGHGHLHDHGTTP